MFEMTAHAYQGLRLEARAHGNSTWVDIIIDGQTVGAVFLHDEKDVRNAYTAADAFNFLMSEMGGVKLLGIVGDGDGSL